MPLGEVCYVPENTTIANSSAIFHNQFLEMHAFENISFVIFSGNNTFLLHAIRRRTVQGLVCLFSKCSIEIADSFMFY